MIRFGMPTLIETATVEEAVALCGELGLDFLELNTNFPLHQPQLLDSARLVELAREQGIFYTIHLNDEMPVAEFNSHVSKGNVDAVLEVIRLAKEIGAKKLNMHLSEGAHYTMPDRIVYFYEAYLEDYLAGICAFRDACASEIGDSGITICIENVSGFRDYQLRALELLLENPCFALTLDVGHNYCTNFMDEDWIISHKDRLLHMHLHDAADGRKDHIALGTGEIDLTHYLALAKEQSCSVVLETKTIKALRDSVRWVKDRGYLR